MSWDLDSAKTWGKSFLHRGESKQEGAEAGSSKACGRTGRRLERLHLGGKGHKQERKPGREVRAMEPRPFGPQVMGSI